MAEWPRPVAVGFQTRTRGSPQEMLGQGSIGAELIGDPGEDSGVGAGSGRRRTRPIHREEGFDGFSDPNRAPGGCPSWTITGPSPCMRSCSCRGRRRTPSCAPPSSSSSWTRSCPGPPTRPPSGCPPPPPADRRRAPCVSLVSPLPGQDIRRPMNGSNHDLIRYDILCMIRSICDTARPSGERTSL
jgi:hypothetical protein